MIVEFEREGRYLPRGPSEEVMAYVYLDDGAVTLRLASEEVAGERQWVIIDLCIGLTEFDVRECASNTRVSRGPEPTLPAGQVLAAVRTAFAEWVAAEATSTPSLDSQQIGE
jgi:hypothetical protein